MKPDADQLLKDAHKLKDDRFKKRDQKILDRAAERFNETVAVIPIAYRKTAQQHKSQIIEDEGRNIGTLVHAMPVVHIPNPTPQDQGKTTTSEQFCTALHDEAEKHFGPVWWQNTLAQTHDNIAWLYWGWKKVPYKGQPQPPQDETDILAGAQYALKNDQFKRDAGVRSYLDYRYVPTGTAYSQGNIYDPDRFYEIKKVPERDMLDKYGITKDSQGQYSKPTEKPDTAPSGQNQNQTSGSETMVDVVEYWDRDWCMIVVEHGRLTWMGARQVKGAFVLQEWEHGWGRVPYFARPAFITDQIAEEKKYAGPLDGVYTEMPEHKILRTMGHAVAYQTAFSPLQLTSEQDSSPILDDSGTPIAFLDLEPGKARQLAPGQKILTVPQSPEIANLFQEIAASQARIEHFSLSPAAKGISPGADTANSALSNLHRFQLSILDPMAEEAAKQASAMYRFALERVQEMGGERVYVYSDKADAYVSLSSDDIVSVNVQAKVTPDQGQFQLLIEKHAAELKQLGLITLQEMYEMWGKENPEQYVLELKAERLADMLDPVVNQQIISDLGMLDAVKAMMQANAQGGSARDAVPGLMQQTGAINNTGAGNGSGGMPRGEGVRSPAGSETTQPQLAGGP